MAIPLEAGRLVPRSIRWTKETFSIFNTFRSRRELVSWKADNRSSFLKRAPKYIRGFPKYRRREDVPSFDQSVDTLTRIFRMPVDDIMGSSPERTYEAVTGRILNFFLYEYLPNGHEVSPLDDGEEMDHLVRESLLTLAYDPSLEKIAGKDCAENIQARFPTAA